jgi:hypothetical protein
MDRSCVCDYHWGGSNVPDAPHSNGRRRPDGFIRSGNLVKTLRIKFEALSGLRQDNRRGFKPGASIFQGIEVSAPADYRPSPKGSSLGAALQPHEQLFVASGVALGHDKRVPPSEGRA